ncbi:MAG: flavin monoamine oxidase family protein [bacterium]
MDRREFILNTAKALGFLYTSQVVNANEQRELDSPKNVANSLAASNSYEQEKSLYDVCVVGAGAAGIYACKLLQEQGKSFVCLEARSRVGGRIYSQKLANGNHIELGAQWLAKSGQTRFASLVKEHKYKPLVNFQDGLTVFLKDNQKQLLENGVYPLSSLGELDVYRVGQQIDQLAKKIAAAKPWHFPSLDQVSVYDWIQKTSQHKESAEYWLNIIESGFCVNPKLLSALECLQGFSTVGGVKKLAEADRYYFAEGIQSIFEKIADSLGNKLVLNSPVLSIEHSENQVIVQTNQSQYQCQKVILALPPQLIGKMLINPALPTSYSNALNNLQTGKVVKMIGVYKKPWWREDNLSGTITSPDSDIDFVIDSSHPSSPIGILVALVGGTRAESINPLNTIAKQELFESFVKTAFGRSEQLEEFYSHDWISDPYSLGAYRSSRGIGEWVKSQNIFSRSFGSIHFAGTETASSWRGYIEGALQSAERAVRRAIKDV